MNPDLAALPDDIATLKAALVVARAEVATALAHCSSDQALIAHLKLEIAKLQRGRLGSRSERSARLLEQMELPLEASATEDELAAEIAATKTSQVAAFIRTRPARQLYRHPAGRCFQRLRQASHGGSQSWRDPGSGVLGACAAQILCAGRC